MTGRRLAAAHSAEDSPGLLLWQVTNRWQAAVRAVLKPHGLTHVQFVLLTALTWLDADVEPITQRRLAELAATDPMMTSQVLRVLEDRQLVRRVDHPVDRRARAVTVTDEGAALANRAVADVEACDREFFAPLGERGVGFAADLGILAGRRTGPAGGT